MKLQDEYIIGSWFDHVSINGSEPLRRFDRSSIVYDESGGAEGSCPFAFVHDPVMGQWIRVGTIITNRKGPEAEGEEVLAIPRLFDGRLLIREIEDEISYIDRIILRAEGAGGEVRQWLPSNDALKYVDGVYVTLQHGDEVLVKYPNLPEDVRNIVVVSNGYFVTPSSLRGKRPGAG